MSDALRAGARLGPYEISDKLGEGGMGEVWRARDTRLDREVALKLLPEAFAADAERHARFEREARTLAGLNHPNIAILYGLEHLDSRHILAMELVEGEGLDERIARGPLPLDEALAIARQITRALEAAHDSGIVHRDLKPANVKVRPDATVKVLDFGLAKAWANNVEEGDVGLSPTITHHDTKPGVIIGTAGYMSPEQARGRPVDRRADIWAFGVLLWEMLAGRRLFERETVSDTLAAVLRAELDDSKLPADTPASLRRLLDYCLERDPGRRLHDIADVRILLDEAADEPAPPAHSRAETSRHRWTTWLGWGAAVMALGLAISVVGWRRTPEPVRGVTRLDAQLPADVRLSLQDVPVLALSRDGRELAFAAVDPTSGHPMIYVRRLDETGAHPIPGTERGLAPFFSPAGDTIAFFLGGRLARISVQGGAATDLAAAPSTRGGTWSPDGSTIYFSPHVTSGIWRVPAAGGTAEPVVEPEADAGERTFRWPQVLPDGSALLFTVGATVSPNNYDAATLEVYSFASRTRKVLVHGANMGRFAPPDHLVYSRAGVLYAVHFDPERLEVSGAPVPVLRGIAGDPSSGAGYFDLAGDGTLAYLPGEIAARDVYLKFMDRAGNAERAPLPPQGFGYPRFSPDGARLAVSVGVNPAGTVGDLWIFTPSNGAMERLTFSGNAVYPAWTPDGARIAYTEMQQAAILLKAADGSGAPEVVMKAAAGRLLPESWSPDGRTLAYVQSSDSTDIYLLTLGGEPRLFEKDASAPVFSPDGRWIAYNSPAAGGTNVFVRPVSGAGKWQISTDAGGYARWPRPGDEIYFLRPLSPDRPVMSAHVSSGAGFEADPPRVLIPTIGTSFLTSTAPGVNWDVAPGAERFVFVEQENSIRSDSAISIALHWAAHLDHSGD